MDHDTLLDFFEEFAPLKKRYVIHDDGYRTHTFGYDDIAAAARQFSLRLIHEGFQKGDAVVIWSENRPEWVVAFWGLLLIGAIVVPIDYRSSADFLRRIVTKVKARAVFLGDEVELETGGAPLDAPVWQLKEFCDLEERGATQGTTKIGPTPESLPRPSISRDDTVEIIFTSGATAEPKGVIITHRNILANINALEGEIGKYRKYGRPFFPLKFLNLLPLSHMFGQALALFIPPLLPGIVFFMRGFNPAEIVRQSKVQRLTFIVCVPKMLAILREYLLRVRPETGAPAPGSEHWLRRWWRFRRVHRLFGWRFLGFIIGAAHLPEELEAFWTRLVFAVIQGYGLTETAPIVTLNHPFRKAPGTVGAPIEGVEVKIGDDGEILVRGDNVTTGYLNAPHETAQAFQDGWLRTGDIGELDTTGRLKIRGRKKEMIVTPEGLNIFPEDVEQVLNEQPGVREAAVVGALKEGAEHVHAILSLEAGADADEIVVRANRTLEEHQKIRGVSIWDKGPLPRTEGTHKLKRRELRRWVEGEAAAAPAAEKATTVSAVVANFAKQRVIAVTTTLEELGLSSLERVELLMALEEAFQTTIDEQAFAEARTIADLERLVADQAVAGPAVPGVTPAPGGELFAFPAWNRSFLARFIRRLNFYTWILPVTWSLTWPRVEGLEHVKEVAGPVVFAANHQSHLDTPAIFAALPGPWRYRLSPAMQKEFFEAHFNPGKYGRLAWFTNSLNYYLAALLFQAFPLPRREAGTRQTLRYIGELVSEGCSILIYPEGIRSKSGKIEPFQPGVGMIASRLHVPVIPVRIEGADRVMGVGQWLPSPGRVLVAFGPALRLAGEDYVVLARQVEEAVRRL